MEFLSNKTIKEKDLNRYVGVGDLPVKSTMGGKPSLTFMSESHTFMYKSEVERDSDYMAILMYFETASICLS
jgi:hypothetical protein